MEGKFNFSTLKNFSSADFEKMESALADFKKISKGKVFLGPLQSCHSN
jgi:hypothetical protein